MSIFGDILSQHTVEQAAGSEADRKQHWQRAQAYYYSRPPKALNTKPGKPDDNTAINYARLLVDKGASFLFGKEIQFDLEAGKKTEEEQWLKKVWKRNRKMTLLHNLGVNGGIYGHCFVRIVLPDQPDGIPRLIVVDPMEVNVRWNPDDIEQIEWYHITFKGINREGKPVQKRHQIRRLDTGQWEIIEEERLSVTHGGTVITEWNELSQEIWPYSFPPLFHCQNLSAPNEFWGMSDLEEDVLEICEAINFIVSNTRKIIRYHGHPKTIGVGFKKQSIEVDTDETIILPNVDAKLWNLEMITNLGSSMEYLKHLERILFLNARVPEVSLGNLDGIGAISGIALQLLYQPLLDKNETKRRLYGEMLELLNAALLVIGGFRQSVDDVDIHVIWPEALPRDMMEERHATGIDMERGLISKENASERLNINYEIEQARIKKEQAEAGPEAGAEAKIKRPARGTQTQPLADRDTFEPETSAQ